MPYCGSALLAIAIAGGTASASAAEVLQTDITHTGDRYTVRFDVRLAAPAEPLKRYLTDYSRYAERFPSIRESQVLGRQPNGDTRLRLRIHGCALFFCRTVTVVKDVKELPNNVVTARVEPTLSSFSEGNERWRVAAEGNTTRLQYEAEMVPAFYVPPLIGPWILKRQLRLMLIENATELEALADG